MKILVVEDSPLIQKAMKMLFQTLHCDIDCASSGKETMKLIEKNTYDMVFLDLGLPDITGLELAKKIRKMKHTRHLKLIASTAHSADDYENECLAAGIDAFYTKPLTEENVTEILNRVSHKH